MKVDVEVGRRAEALNQRDGAAVGFVRLEPGLTEQCVITRCITCSTGVTSLGCAASSRRSGIGSDRTHWRIGTCGDDVVHQVSRRLRHAPSAARRAKAAPHAAEGDKLVVAAVAAVEAQEAMRQDAAFEEGVELVFDEPRQVGACSVFGLGAEGRGVLLH